MKPVDNEPALIIKTDEGDINLVIADIHLGFEESLEEKGVNLPSQTSKLIAKAIKLIQKNKANRLIILGDLKHQVPGMSKRELNEVITFLEAIKDMHTEILFIPGNHDGGLPDVIEEMGLAKVCDSRGIMLRTIGGRVIGLTHGHAWPSDEVISNADVLIVGHTHPVVELVDTLGYRYLEPVWVKVRVNQDVLKDKYYDNVDAVKLKCVIVEPHFNTFLSGNIINRPDVMRPLLGPLLESDAIMIEEAEIFLLDGTYLGTLRNIRLFASRSSSLQE
ncbi:MAG: hypothetical protein DRJ66_06095 [Thermoprotei archaeon]|nr:MAG: hypothetical protein DRJ66_06095 [Thermoprotei archaeon]RLF18287.1 MAG: hypothetical protein DRZ82_08535 [Thermoprotei archaeon]